MSMTDTDSDGIELAEGDDDFLLPDLWTQAEAIDLAKKLEEISPKFGCHVGLTGGCLYRDGERKDCDILFYRIRQVEMIDKEGLLKELFDNGIVTLADYGFCVKTRRNGKSLDLLFPDEIGGDYQTGDSHA